MAYEDVTIYSDGGARGNPGPAGIGYVILEGKNVLHEGKRYMGEATNNQAEYTALLEALEKASELGVQRVQCFLDSELVVKQLHREYKVKDAKLAKLFVKVWNVASTFQEVSYQHVRREKNKHADRLVNEAIDEVINGA